MAWAEGISPWILAERITKDKGMSLILMNNLEKKEYVHRKEEEDHTDDQQ